MKRIFAALACAALSATTNVAGAVALAAPAPQAAPAAQAPAKKEIKLPKAELDAYTLVKNAVGPDATIAAAKDFVAKYPQSAALDTVEVDVYNAIESAPRDAKLEGYAASFKEMFPASQWNAVLQRIIIDAYLKAGDLAAVNRTAEAYLATTPDDVRVHLTLLQSGFDGLKKGDASTIESAKAHGLKAIELFEADKKPSDVSDADWAKMKTTNLAAAHQTLGVIVLQRNDLETAVTHLTAASKLNPTDPLSYFFLGAAGELQADAIAQKFNAMPNKDAADAKKLRADADAKEDEIIGYFAKAVAYSQGKPEFAPLEAQARPSLEQHYKRRHKDSLDGLPAAIAAAKGVQ